MILFKEREKKLKREIENDKKQIEQLKEEIITLKKENDRLLIEINNSKEVTGKSKCNPS